ncbi:hypothetical protein RJ639_023760 [Escallonia herrerae]|uniref:Uncharacterized protein n=1 Tax=Escallonia herrerae TaxID=1293975 RepID=A0AA88UYY6_9ASTE|nr:hypothetical protein RJ639_023760 [Escallonia herrerae]
MKIVDSTIILEEMEGLNENRRGEGDTAKLQSCLESILRIGVLCSAELPHERRDSGNVDAAMGNREGGCGDEKWGRWVRRWGEGRVGAGTGLGEGEGRVGAGTGLGEAEGGD